ncbi:MAG: hypothetical protein WAT74_05210 [Flavobacteriales bacterium]
MMLRNTLAIALLTVLVSARAQQSPFLFFEAAQPVSQQSLKLLHEAIAGVDPQAQLFHNDDLTILQLKSAALQPEAIYRATIEANGVALRPGLRTADELGINTVPAVPVFVATGDAAGDRARYRAAVELWNAQHPDELLSPTPVHER